MTTPLKSIGDYKREMARLHGTGPQPNGLACPLCGKELMDTSPSVMLPSNPPLKCVKCFYCGWTGAV